MPRSSRSARAPTRCSRWSSHAPSGPDVKRRAAALGLLLFAVYASTLGMHAFGRSDYGGDEAHYLLTAKSIVEDGNPDLRDEYATRAYAEFYPYDLMPHGSLTSGRVNEPHGV